MTSVSDSSGFLVVDLEATCWERPQGRPNEIIEIGAVAATPRGQFLGEFQSFVRPMLHPRLSDFCMRLTSILQADVDAAPSFPEVLAALRRWAQEWDSLTLASWGAYDREQLRQDCELHNIPYPFGDEHVNLKKVFSRIFNRRRMGMARALRTLGIESTGTHHRGIDDARNIVRILQRMLRTAPGQVRAIHE